MDQPKKIIRLFEAINTSLFNRSLISKVDKEENQDVASRINLGKRR